MLEIFFSPTDILISLIASLDLIILSNYEKLINEEYMPRMQEGLDIFNSYKIYD